MHKGFVVSGLVVLTALVGCTPGAITPLPTTPQGCVADYNAGKKRLNTPTYVASNGNAGASLFGAALGRGIAAGGLESRYKACLAQFGPNGTITDAQTYTPNASGAATDTPASAREDYVPELDPSYSAYEYDCGSTVMIGGSGYCIRGKY